MVKLCAAVPGLKPDAETESLLSGIVVQAFPLYVSTTLAVLPGAFTVAVQVVSVPLPDATYVTGFGEHDIVAVGVTFEIVNVVEALTAL